MHAIFLSYRRDDAEGQAGRLFDDLVKHFGEDSVFMDVAGIEPGKDFRRVIDEKIASCGVLLTLIGKNWLAAINENGKRRLDDEKDFVRLEIASALKRSIPVIPVLVRGAQMPVAEQLPAEIADLAYRNATELSHARWETDVASLIKALSQYVKPLPEKTVVASDLPYKKSRVLKKILYTGLGVLIVVAAYLAYTNGSAPNKLTTAADTPNKMADTGNKTANRGGDSGALPHPDTSSLVIPATYTLEGTWEDDQGRVFAVVADANEKDSYEMEQIKPAKEHDVLWKATLTKRDVEIGIFAMPSGSHQGQMNLKLSIDGKRMVGLLEPGGASPDFTPMNIHFRRIK
jgi:hypothetical protein